ncbi:hypothetical protein CQA38_03005 [Campylobacter sp. MIT 12-5580]|uniref:hypothetical protein n=1 Tax=Campylobacter sp. MIT 12-5580 TaxID=2040651 RepID=UPI0010F7D313|nr:hypothetical protein [Campylobacter sp. MIT 12-5580]TKX29757.1 hypothetical protein CQA38_03005 [Campylobacter sp. MIT 12-5580]
MLKFNYENFLSAADRHYIKNKELHEGVSFNEILSQVQDLSLDKKLEGVDFKSLTQDSKILSAYRKEKEKIEAYADTFEFDESILKSMSLKNALWLKYYPQSSSYEFQVEDSLATMIQRKQGKTQDLGANFSEEELENIGFKRLNDIMQATKKLVDADTGASVDFNSLSLREQRNLIQNLESLYKDEQNFAQSLHFNEIKLKKEYKIDSIMESYEYEISALKYENKDTLYDSFTDKNGEWQHKNTPLHKPNSSDELSFNTLNEEEQNELIAFYHQRDKIINELESLTQEEQEIVLAKTELHFVSQEQTKKLDISSQEKLNESLNPLTQNDTSYNSLFDELFADFIAQLKENLQKAIIQTSLSFTDKIALEQNTKKQSIINESLFKTL